MRIITLCGSTRFKDEINHVNADLTMSGNLVISLGVFGHTDMPHYDWRTNNTDLKRMLDELHRRKIDLADTIYVVNKDKYIGESTMDEMRYARMKGKAIWYYECPDIQCPGFPHNTDGGDYHYPIANWS